MNFSQVLIIYVFTVLICDAARLEKRHGDEFHGCDNGKTGIEIDMQNEGDWKCLEGQRWNLDAGDNRTVYKCYDYETAYHVCIDKTINDLYQNVIPNSGPHREVWGQYGEYTYLPPGRYVHNLEHGGVVFMYHPCAPTHMVDQLRRVATSCLYRYIMTPFGNLTKEFPFAVVTYGCVYRSSIIDPLAIKAWVRGMFGKSPEADVYGDGNYNYGLQVASVNRRSGSHDKSTFCADQPNDHTPLSLFGIVETTAAPEVLTEMAKSLSTQVLNKSSEDLVTSANHISKSKITAKKEEDAWTKVLFNNQTIDQMNFAKDGYDTFWILSALMLLVCGVFTALCLIRMCMRSKTDEVTKLRVWNDENTNDSFNVAAIVRKLPRAFRKDPKVDSKFYQRVEMDDQSTDDEGV